MNSDRKFHKTISRNARKV